MQNEMDVFHHCKKFVYNHDFEKSDDALLEYVILYEKDYYKLLFFGVNNFTIQKNRYHIQQCPRFQL